jgi:hypothetical protein
VDDVVMVEPSKQRRWRSAGLIGAGLVAGLVLAGLTAAAAQSTAPTAAPSPTPTARPDTLRDGKPLGHRGFGHRGPGGGLGGVLHGEGTTKAPGGGYQVVAVQLGDVTEVSATSITVKSEDGYSRTYAVTDDTLVNAGDTGIGDVKAGHRVHVTAIVTGGSARAVRVADVTTLRDLRGRWRPERRHAAEPTPSA